MVLFHLPGDTFINRKFDLVSRFIAPKRRKLAMLVIVDLLNKLFLFSHIFCKLNVCFGCSLVYGSFIFTSYLLSVDVLNDISRKL